jgi:hypothetical protein
VIFVDTGAFLARHLVRDEHHHDAARGWRGIREERPLTSNLVLAEAFTLLARWAGGAFAAQRAAAILRSERMEILRPGLADELEAVPLLEKYADQKVSFTDCVSFVLMRKLGIDRAFSFDRHFLAAGFRLWP